uniref:Ig-like domain-containing protein n=1 Tax=Electrophorus electricus TaxID=8005 RepID=A0A4W4E234_ELEEL
NSTTWRVMQYTQNRSLSNCPPGKGSVTRSTCNISSLSTSHTGVYWCQSKSLGSSKPVNITVHDGDVILDSPVHPVTEGDSLTLRCLLNKTSSNLISYFYKDGSLFWNQTTGQITIPVISKSDEGLYYCEYPERRESPQSWVSVRDVSSLVSLIIIPNRTQHFSGHSLSLSCEDQRNSTTWRVMQDSQNRSVSDCPSDMGSVTSSTCNISSLSTAHTGMYWCQSKSVGSSKSVNITVHDGDVILDSPVHPVTEGDPLTLQCLLNKTPSNLIAYFYKDGSFIQDQTTGQITIHAISKSDEGLYHCEYPERRASPQSWVSVRGGKSNSSYLIYFALNQDPPPHSSIRNAKHLELH